MFSATVKACDAAIQSRQWNKAIQILSVIDDRQLTSKYYVKIARHFASIGEYEMAERYFIEADATKEAIDMYNNAGKWEQAHRVCTSLYFLIKAI